MVKRTSKTKAGATKKDTAVKSRKSTPRAGSRGKASAPAKTRSTKSPKVAAPQATRSSPLLAIYQKAVDQAQRKEHLVANGLDQRMYVSSGCLMLDYLSNGGIYPGMHIVGGKEQSGKSTSAMHVLGSALQAQVPIITYFDPEGSVDPQYTGKILPPGYDVKSVFYSDPSRAKYYRSVTMEQAFNTMHSVIRKIPDKLYSPDLKSWCYLIPKRNKVFAPYLSAGGLKPDNSIKDDVYYWCPTDFAAPEALFIVDSWPSLLTNVEEDSDDLQGAMALQARSLAAQLRRVVGQLIQKGVIIYSVNQIRERPAVRFGSPEYEPGGNALKHYSNCRHVFNAVSVPQDMTYDKKNVAKSSVEKSVIVPGANDNYMYKTIRNIKNKYGNPNRAATIRVWVSDHQGIGRGIDPYYDVWQYLRLTNQIKGNRRGFTVTIDPNLAGKKLRPEELKTLILAERLGLRSLKKAASDILGSSRLPRLYARCQNQLRTGKTFELATAATVVKPKDSELEDFEDVDSDEDIENV